MGKLGDQLKSNVQIQETRTERLRRKQDLERERKNYENLKSRANEKQKEFSQLQSIEEYEKEYLTLDPELKPFFETPNELRIKKEERITTTKTTVQEKLSYADQKIAEAREKFKRQELRYEKDRDNLRKKNYSSEKYNEKVQRLKDNLRDDENNLDEAISKWQGYKQGLDKGLKELTAKKDLDINAIEKYAYDVARYEEKKEEARNKQKDFDYKQSTQIKQLESQGYKPFVVQQFDDKGNPKTTELTYINTEKQDVKTITTFKDQGKINVTGLSKLGYSSPQERSLIVGGKEFKFKSNIGVYKDKKGNVVTPYGKTGFTEDQLIKQSQDQAYSEWQKEQQTQPIAFPYRLIENKSVNQGTYYSDFNKTLISDEQYFKQQEKKPLNIGKVFGGVKQGFNYIDERIHFDLGGTASYPKLSLSFGKKEDQTIPEQLTDLGVQGLQNTSQKLENWAIGKDKIEDFETGLETKYQTQYQQSFDNKYMKDLIYENMDFETASKKFEESDEAKLLQKQYQEEYEKGYEELQISPSRLKKWGAGAGRTGLNLGTFGLKATKSPTRVITTAGAVYGGVKVLGAIPNVITYTGTGGIFVYGTYKALSPKSTIDEAGGGLVTAVISGATLGYAGYKYLRSPVVKSVNIKPPKANLKASQSIGKDVKILTDKGEVNRIIYENQKLSQTATAGRRTVVTSKGREFSRRFWKELGLKIDNSIYKGIPSQQLGRSTTYTGIRGSYTVRGQSAYQKAFKRLTDYGYSSSQAKSTLRYYAPRVYETYLDRGMITIKGEKALGKFEYLYKQPVLNVDKKLGINTRGGSTTKDIYRVERKLIDFKGNKLVLEEKTRLSLVLDKSGKIKDFKNLEFSKGVVRSKASELQKGYEVLNDGSLKTIRPINYKDMISISIEKNLLPKNNIIKFDKTNTILIDDILDLRSKQTGIKFTGKKTPFSKTFSEKDFVLDIIDKPKASNNVNKIIDKIDDFSTSPTQSQYYGTGQYERSEVYGNLPQQVQNQLKSFVQPSQVKAYNIGKISKVNDFNFLKGFEVGTLGSLKTSTGFKSNIKFKQDLNVKSDLKTLLRSNMGFASKQSPLLKQSTQLKSQLKSILKSDLSFAPSLKDPVFRSVKNPSIKDPTIPKLIIPFQRGKLEKGKRKKSKGDNEYAYLPDFTSRALGLKEESITEKQAQSQLKKILTGLEIRRGVKVKW